MNLRKESIPIDVNFLNSFSFILNYYYYTNHKNNNTCFSADEIGVPP